MKTNDKKQLHTLSVDELKTKLAELEKQLIVAQGDFLAGREKNVLKVREQRRDKARILTVLRYKELTI